MQNRATVMQKLISAIEKISTFSGKGIAWFNLFLVVLICYDVLMRYLFNTTYVAIIELEWHLFSFIFLIGASHALKEDRHVRVDVFYSGFSPKKKALVNLSGTLIFLIPFCLIIIISSLRFVSGSFEMNEGSPDPGGLPARWLVKSAIPIGFSLLLIQAVALVLQSVQTIVKGSTKS
jgi:TRAP-type mannitol/chloroaromatic compound transport system permease small subunit